MIKMRVIKCLNVIGFVKTCVLSIFCDLKIGILIYLEGGQIFLKSFGREVMKLEYRGMIGKCKYIVFEFLLVIIYS